MVFERQELVLLDQKWQEVREGEVVRGPGGEGVLKYIRLDSGRLEIELPGEKVVWRPEAVGLRLVRRIEALRVWQAKEKGRVVKVPPRAFTAGPGNRNQLKLKYSLDELEIRLFEAEVRKADQKG
jgi:hypothetical protein